MRQKQSPLITKDEITRISAPQDKAYTLPAAAYTSEEIYRAEQKKIFKKSWLPIGRIEQLPEAGSFIAADLLDQPIIAVRDTEQEIRVLSNVCLHRAARLVQGEGKQLKFTCPYHAWSYDTKGQLIAAPMMETAKNFEIRDCKLPEIRSEIWEGFIMATLDPNAKPFASQVKGLTEQFTQYQIAEHVIQRTLEFDSNWNWKVLVENFMEAYHHIGTHSTTLQPGFPSRQSRVPDNDGPWSILEMPTGESAEDAANHGSLKPTPGIKEEDFGTLWANVAFPCLTFAVQSDMLIWFQIIPRTVDNFLLKVHLCIHKQNLDLPDLQRQLDASAEIVSFIHTEDIAANDIVWRGLNAPLTTQGRLSTYEKSIWQMNQWWLSKMELA